MTKSLLWQALQTMGACAIQSLYNSSIGLMCQEEQACHGLEAGLSQSLGCLLMAYIGISMCTAQRRDLINTPRCPF